MKKIYLLLVCTFFATSQLEAQDVSLPLGPFRDFLLTNYPACFVNTDVNGFLMLNSSCATIQSVTSLNMSFQLTSDPVDLEGLQYFTALRGLTITGGVVNFVYPASVDTFICNFCVADAPFGNLPLPPNLKYLDCSGNSIGSIAFPASLRYIDCSDNCLSSIPTLPANLDTLDCSGQLGTGPVTPLLTSLPALPASLKYLDCSTSNLTSLPSVWPASLLYLDCSSNYYNTNPESIMYSLASIASLPSNLQTLKCNNNRLTSLPPLPPSLKYLDCSLNRFFGFDLTPFGPQTVVFEGIDALPASLPPQLEYLNCSGNRITELPSLPATLTYLNVKDNVRVPPLAPQTQGIQCLPHLPAGLIFLDAQGTLVNCIPNNAGFTTTLPLCSPTNNSNLCVSSPIISGTFYYDNNSNGIREPNENYRANVEVINSLSAHAYSNINGYFEISGDIGSVSVNPLPPPYYSVSPSSNNYSFNNYDTIVTQLYALQPTVSIDSVTVLISARRTANPGFSYDYHVVYENVGTTVVGANLTLNYDASRLTYSSSSVPGVVNNGNNLTFPVINLSPGDRGAVDLIFTVSNTAALGDTLRANIRCVANTDISTDSTYDVIQGSFDPNDKTATPIMNVAEVAAGKYVNYLVRFQNTGTDTAINVVITDVLNSLLDANSFQMLDASHSCITKRTGNNLTFEFAGIMLPDSNVNEVASHGYLRFRVKPVAGILPNSVIPNLAEIYFDFNSPIITNTANTLISVDVVPLTLLEFDATVDKRFKAARLQWKTSHEVNTRSFEIERSKDGRVFEKVGTKYAMGFGDNTYDFTVPMSAALEYYRLKMIDVDARYKYSNIIKVQLETPNDFSLINTITSESLILDVHSSELENKQAMIIDSKGSVLLNVNAKSGRQSLPINKFAPGIYYLKLGERTKKFLIIR